MAKKIYKKGVMNAAVKAMDDHALAETAATGELAPVPRCVTHSDIRLKENGDYGWALRFQECWLDDDDIEQLRRWLNANFE